MFHDLELDNWEKNVSVDLNTYINNLVKPVPGNAYTSNLCQRCFKLDN